MELVSIQACQANAFSQPVFQAQLRSIGPLH